MPQSINNIKWSIPIKPSRGLLDTIFAFGCTSNPMKLYRNQGRHRIVGCPYCSEEVEVPKYTREGTIIICSKCGDLFKFRKSF